MTTKKKFVFGLTAAALSFAIETITAHAAGDDAQIARQKINLSGRQRMLTQRMTASACIAATGMDSGARAQIAQAAHDDFSAALTGLRDGDTALGLPIETHIPIREAFDAVEALWQLSPAVQQLAAGYGNSETLTQIMSKTVDLLILSNEAVQRIVAKYGGSNIDAGVAKAIDVAGRQRMLSQRMVKSACFVFVGVGGEEAQQELADAISLFESSLHDLINGNPSLGISAPPTSPITEQLEVVQNLWGPFRARLEALSAEQDPNPEALLEIAVQGDEVLAQAHQAVLRYVEMAQSKTEG